MGNRSVTAQIVTGGGQSRRRPAEDARRDILRAAERRFADEGFAATRLEDIGADVGIGRAGVLYHFGSKPALYSAVLERALFPFLEKAKRTLASPGTIRDRGHAAVRLLVRELAENPDVAKLATRELATRSADVDAVIQTIVVPFRTLLETTFDGARRSGEVRADFDLRRFLSLAVGPVLYYFTALPALLREPLEELTNPINLAALEADLCSVVDVTLGVGRELGSAGKDRIPGLARTKAGRPARRRKGRAIPRRERRR